MSETGKVGKRVQFDAQVWSAIDLLRRERRRSFQQLADEAFRDLLEKHHHPAGLERQLKESLGEPEHRPKRRRKSDAPA